MCPPPHIRLIKRCDISAALSSLGKRAASFGSREPVARRRGSPGGRRSRQPGLRGIVIEPKRCLLTFSEFTLKEFERDKEGNWIDDIPDGNDHSIDAVRYAMLDDILRG